MEPKYRQQKEYKLGHSVPEPHSRLFQLKCLKKKKQRALKSSGFGFGRNQELNW